jgi:hypothetical protein
MGFKYQRANTDWIRCPIYKEDLIYAITEIYSSLNGFRVNQEEV